MIVGDILEVVAAVILLEGRVLACRRRPEKAAGGKWEFPGGKIEPGESAGEALQREIAEELGCDIRILDELTTNDTPVAGRIIRLTCIRAELAGPAPSVSTDHDRLQWMHPGELPTLDWAEPDLPAVRLLAASTGPFLSRHDSRAETSGPATGLGGSH